jgi:hypothetical protein
VRTTARFASVTRPLLSSQPSLPLAEICAGFSLNVWRAITWFVPMS